MKQLSTFLVLALAALALVACGGGGDTGGSTAESPETAEPAEAAGGEAGAKEASGGSAASGAVEFETDPNGGLAYTTDEVKAKSGKVKIDLNNPQALTHDVAIENSSGETIAQTDLIAEGSDSTTADLKPGEYTYYCTVPGHREAGMEGTLVVE